MRDLHSVTQPRREWHGPIVASFYVHSQRHVQPRLISAHGSGSTIPEDTATKSLQDEEPISSPDSSLELSRATVHSDAIHDSSQQSTATAATQQQLASPESYSSWLVAAISATEAAGNARLQHSEHQPGAREQLSATAARMQQETSQLSSKLNNIINYIDIALTSTAPAAAHQQDDPSVATTEERAEAQPAVLYVADSSNSTAESLSSDGSPPPDSSLTSSDTEPVLAGRSETPGNGGATGGANSWFQRQMPQWQRAGFVNDQRTRGVSTASTIAEERSDDDVSVNDEEDTEGDDEEPTASVEVDDHEMLYRYNTGGGGSEGNEDDGEAAVHVWTVLADGEAFHEAGSGEDMAGDSVDRVDDDDLMIESELDSGFDAEEDDHKPEFDSAADCEEGEEDDRGEGGDEAASAAAGAEYQPKVSINELHKLLLDDEDSGMQPEDVDAEFLRSYRPYPDSYWDDVESGDVDSDTDTSDTDGEGSRGCAAVEDDDVDGNTSKSRNVQPTRAQNGAQNGVEAEEFLEGIHEDRIITEIQEAFRVKPDSDLTVAELKLLQERLAASYRGAMQPGKGLRKVEPPAKSSSKKGSKSPPAQFPGVRVPVRIYWDADNIRFTKPVYNSVARLLGDVQVRAMEVFACGGTAASLCARNDGGGKAATERPAGGVLHVDIHSDVAFKSKTDMQLATHALVAANHDPESNFVIVSNDNDFLPLIRSLQTLRRRVVVVTFARRASSITTAADGWIGLNTPKKPGRPAPLKSGTPLVCASSHFEDTCTRLADCLVLCSGNIFSKLRSRLKMEPELWDKEVFPTELKTCKAFKRSLAKGLKGEEWTSKEKAAVAQLLLDHENDDLFSQLGYLLKAKRRRPQGVSV